MYRQIYDKGKEYEMYHALNDLARHTGSTTPRPGRYLVPCLFRLIQPSQISLQVSPEDSSAHSTDLLSELSSLMSQRCASEIPQRIEMHFHLKM
jgi:hypothetical protein